MKKKKRSARRYPKLRGKTRERASKFIAEEVRTGKYPRKQAIAIGISRARTAAKKSRIDSIVAKYL